MTQRQFNKNYKDIYPHWQVMTLTDRRLYYNELIEQHRVTGFITQKQAQTWGHPSFLESHKEKTDCSKY